MKHEVVVTGDGSHTFYVPALNEHYHSKYGALTESMHIFIENGFRMVDKGEVRVLEIGFGTGLNALLTFRESGNMDKKVYYESIEKYPLDSSEYGILNYAQGQSPHLKEVFDMMHDCTWDREVELSDRFILHKKHTNLEQYAADRIFDIIYFDAFAPEVQPELWTKEIFAAMYNCLGPNGLLVTYSVKGAVKKNLQDAGFIIKKFAGPPGGKKENLQAFKRC